MKTRCFFLLAAFFINTSLADFTRSNVWLHPNEPVDQPFLIQISGWWPNDCHPGEQKPIISEYTGNSVLIEFETIVEHVTCNEVETQYRVLVDMSDVVGSRAGQFEDIEITVRFGESELTESKLLSCALVSPCPITAGWQIKPEAGLYHSDGLEKQGLLLARQGQRLAIYPLVYDETGGSEWLFGAGGIDEGVYFTELYELTGGQCLGCPPPDNSPELATVAKLTLYVEKQGTILVKIDDGPFITYKQSEFGYGSRDVGGNPRERFPDLSGRWAFAETDTKPSPNGSSPPTELLPLVFDITLESVFVSEPIVVTIPPQTPPGTMTYSIWDMFGEKVALMECTNSKGCVIRALDYESGDSVFGVSLRSVERMYISYSGVMVAVGIAAHGFAVRID